MLCRLRTSFEILIRYFAFRGSAQSDIQASWSRAKTYGDTKRAASDHVHRRALHGEPPLPEFLLGAKFHVA